MTADDRTACIDSFVEEHGGELADCASLGYFEFGRGAVRIQVDTPHPGHQKIGYASISRLRQTIAETAVEMWERLDAYDPSEVMVLVFDWPDGSFTCSSFGLDPTGEDPAA